jgi:hypothetical protein
MIKKIYITHEKRRKCLEKFLAEVYLLELAKTYFG